MTDKQKIADMIDRLPGKHEFGMQMPAYTGRLSKFTNTIRAVGIVYFAFDATDSLVGLAQDCSNCSAAEDL